MSNSQTQPEGVALWRRDAPAWLALVVFAVAVWLVYGAALSAPFIFDDQASVLQNQSIRSLWPLWGDAERPGPLNPPIEHPTSARPLVNLSFALNYHFDQLDPRGYRVVNLALHLANAMLIWALVRQTLRLQYFGGRFERNSGWLALAVGLLWAVHPLATETVVYITQRTELLMASCYLGTLYCSIRYWSAETPWSRGCWLALAVLAALAGAASKEVIVTAPIVVLLYDWTFRGGELRRMFRNSWPLYAGLTASWLLLAVLQAGSPRSESAGFGLGVPLIDWWCTQAEIFVMYLKLAVWPWPLAIHYQWPHLETLGNAWPYVLIVVMLVAAVAVLLWRHSAVGFLAACVLLILAPTHAVPIATEIAAERRMYLPLAAIVALIVGSAYRLLFRYVSFQVARRLAIGATAAVALIFVAVSYHRMGDFHDVVVLWQQVVDLQPHNHVAQTNLAGALAATERPADAVAHYRAALQVKPDFVEGRYQLGMALAAAGDIDGAIAELQRVVAEKPDAFRIRNNLGVLLFTAGRLPEAIAEFEDTLALQPDFTEARDNLNRVRRASTLPQKPQ